MGASVIVGALSAVASQATKMKSARDQKKQAKKQMEMSERQAKEVEATEIAKGRREAERKKVQQRAYASGRQSLLQGSGVQANRLG